MVECICFVGEVSDEDVQRAIVVVVTEIDPHSTFCHTVLVIRCARKGTDVHKTPIADVAVEKIRRCVVGDIDINTSIVVVVPAGNTEPFAIVVLNACLPRDIGKCPVAIVSVKGV